jgi:hypothetical protein
MEAAERAEQPPGKPFTPEDARKKVLAAYSRYPAGPVLQGTEDPPVEAWPEPLAEAAFTGLAGKIIRAIEPHTEADPAALLLQLLCAVGNVVGHGPHFRVEADRHTLNISTVIVGPTSSGRKGTSWGRIRRLFEKVDSEWLQNRIVSGLSSGEGLINAVKDEEDEGGR